MTSVAAVVVAGAESTPPVNLPPARRLNLFALVCLIFFTVSGGAYGLEPLVGAVGAGWAVVLIIATPLLWSLPIALMVAELASALPAEGGYYVWVRRALGDYWGAQEGWWTICYTAVDMAIYPVLFVDYLAYFIPALTLDENAGLTQPVFWYRWLIVIALIAGALVINWRGARAVGLNAGWNIALVLAPFVVLVLVGLWHTGTIAAGGAAIRHGLAQRASPHLLAEGLAIVLWNYFGWDNVSTFAGEVNEPRRNYPRALMLALPLTVAAYLLPVLIGVAVTVDPVVWSEAAGWPVIAEVLGGHWLGLALAVAALLSAWSLFNSQVLYVSRLPYAMARDGWLPAVFARASTRTGVPHTALVVSCALSALFAALPFGKIVIIDVLLYAAALALEFVALMVLRRQQPELARPFRIPGGTVGLCLVACAPLCVIVVVLLAILRDTATNARQLWLAGLMAASGSLLYVLRRKQVQRRREPLPD